MKYCKMLEGMLSTERGNGPGKRAGTPKMRELNGYGNHGQNLGHNARLINFLTANFLFWKVRTFFLTAVGSRTNYLTPYPGITARVPLAV